MASDNQELELAMAFVIQPPDSFVLVEFNGHALRPPLFSPGKQGPN